MYQCNNRLKTKMLRLSLMILCLFFGGSLGIQCRDENNQIVDWFVMYKLPKFKYGSDPLLMAGVGYTYITSATVSSGWRMSAVGVESSTSMLANTLAPLYTANPVNNVAVLYNDHAPNGGAKGTRGHTKGVVMTDGTTGFWLVHSVPKFPPIPGSGIPYSYAPTAKKNGQSVLCISVNADQVETIATQLTYIEIIPYHTNWDTNLGNDYPTLLNITNKQYINNPPYNNKETIRSMGGLEFVSFAKGSRWGNELYHGYVAPQLNSDLLAQTWRNGPGKIQSSCTGKKVHNIQSILIQVPNESVYIISNTGVDHSKWAISGDAGANGNWVCIGDINRATTQQSRGGGTVCVKLPLLWQRYADITNDFDMC